MTSISNTLQFQGRTFTTQYFVQTPSKADTKKKEYALFQSSIHPPHFKLLVGEEVWEVWRLWLFKNLFLVFLTEAISVKGLFKP